MKKEIAVVVSNDNENVNVYQTIDAIEKAGFKNVFVQWYNKPWETSQQEQLNYIRNKNLNVIFAHLSYHGINDLWLHTEAGQQLLEGYLNDLKVCKGNGINMVCMHLTSKSTAPAYNEIGLNRIREIVDYAKRLGIIVTFENTKIAGYLDYVIDNIKDENVGICLDSGHYHAHFKDQLNWAKFNKKIYCLHLHDNDQSGDQHLIPFDGTLDWKDFVSKLKQVDYQGYITLELCYRREYTNMTIEQFYQKGYQVANQIAEMFEK